MAKPKSAAPATRGGGEFCQRAHSGCSGSSRPWDDRRGARAARSAFVALDRDRDGALGAADLAVALQLDADDSADIASGASRPRADDDEGATSPQPQPPHTPSARPVAQACDRRRADVRPADRVRASKRSKPRSTAAAAASSRPARAATAVAPARRSARASSASQRPRTAALPGGCALCCVSAFPATHYPCDER